MVNEIIDTKTSIEFQKGFQRGLETILTIIKNRTYSMDDLIQFLEAHLKVSDHD